MKPFHFIPIFAALGLVVGPQSLSAAEPQHFDGPEKPSRNAPRDRAGQIPSRPGGSFNPQTPNRNAAGPWDNDVLVYRLGADGRVEKLAAFERAGVPTATRLKDGRLLAAFQHFPADDNRNFDRVAVAFSSDEGRTWNKPEPIEVEGMEPGLARPFDPTLVPSPDGRIRLYFTSNRSPDFRRSVPAIYSAISTDGTHYAFEPGVRFALEGRLVIDCAAALHNGVFHLIVPDNGRPEEMTRGQQRGEPPRGNIGYHAVSQDGLNFERQADVTLPRGSRWLGNMQSDGGRLAFFGSGPGPWPVISTDGASWKTGEPASRVPGADPGAVKLRDGSWLLLVTGPPRPGTSSAQRQRFQPPPGRPPIGDNRPEVRGSIRVEKIESKYAVAPATKAGSFVTGQEADLVLGAKGFNNAGGPLLFNHPTGLATDGKVLLMTDRWNNRVLLWKSAPASNTPPDLVLGQPDFTQNNPGAGKHQLNWPGNVAITPDGKHIAVTDTHNDRILIWNSFPTKNGAAADLVLDLTVLSGGAPASGPARLPIDSERRSPNRPVSKGLRPVSPHPDPLPQREGIASQRSEVHQSSDKQSGSGTVLPLPAGEGRGEGERRVGESPLPSRLKNQRAEPEVGAPSETRRARPEPGAPRARFDSGMRFGWPWGVWTDGQKFAVAATHGSAVLIWNSFPTRDHQPPDLVLRPREAGTPRNVTSDGKTFFAVSDHNYGDDSRPATAVWLGFPKNGAQPPDFTWSEWVKGSFTSDRKLVLAGIQSVFLWNKAPRDAETDGDVVLRPATYRNGDGPDAVVANGRLYVCNYNGNQLLGWNSLPTRDNQPPDLAIGSERIEQDTWAENFFIQNPVVATDGQSLFISSDFDRKMFVWRQLPDESAAKPDLVLHLPEGPWDNELHGSTLMLAGRNTVYIWRKLPLNGEQPDVTLSGTIGSVRLGELSGVAFDDQYFYLADRRAKAIYVWEGIPARDSEPKFTLAMRSPGRLNSDGEFLCAAPFEGSTISLWRVSELSARAEPITLAGPGRFNLPSQCLIAGGRLFVANRNFNRVDVWNRLEDALAGRPADALLGASDEFDRKPGIGRNQLFMPGSLAWGGGYLWVGEFKFSTRILRFTPKHSVMTPRIHAN
ncbi:MAG: hypothetical protein HY735_23370 [Verrucomicrobia bacterium]|nr:hypothetical protein [Verrucomicrobiota bacterium]